MKKLTSCVPLLVLEISLMYTAIQLRLVTAGESPSPFRSTNAPSDTINNYEVVVPVVTQTTVGIGEHPRRLTVTVNTLHPQFILHLELNEHLIPPHFTSRYYDEYDDEIVEKGHVNCFYQGTVQGHPGWRVTMSTCHGLRGFFGDLQDETQQYHIEPLDSHLTTLDQPHALYLATEYQKRKGTLTCGSKHKSSSVPHIEVSKERLKRQTANGLMIVEWALVNDMTQYEEFNRNITATVMRNLEIANFVDSVFQTLNIRIVLVDVTTWTNGDRIIVSSNPDVLLDNFEVYRPQISATHDSAMLITGVNLDGNTVGIAFIGTMCNDRSSVGVTQDGRGVGVEAVGSTAAHELGHIFNMDHDDPQTGRSCSCGDPSGVCIMAGISGSPPPTQWSDCSRSDIQRGFDSFNLDRCLMNEPTNTVGDPVCGNGIRERDEICDCGSVEECRDPCCNATSCELSEGAQCFAGDCCDDNCKFVPYGTTCREASQECDILEYCSGESSECPADLHLQDGHDCNNKQSYCFSGTCVTYDGQCDFHFGQGSSVGVDRCFTTFNVRGNTGGNCGSSGSQYVGCATQDALCGQLQCTANPSDFINNANRAVTIVTNGIGGNRCVSFTTSAGADTPSPGLVADGSRCQSEKICFIQKCISVSDLPGLQACPMGTNGLTCSGNGVCNNLNQCSCNLGFDGVSCQPPVVTQPTNPFTGAASTTGSTTELDGSTTGSTTEFNGSPKPTGAAANVGATAGGVVGAIIVLAAIVAAICVVVILVLRHKRRHDKYFSNPEYNNHSVKSPKPISNAPHSIPTSASVTVRPAYNDQSSSNTPMQHSSRPLPSSNPPSQIVAVNPRPSLIKPPTRPIPLNPTQSRPAPVNPPPSRPAPVNVPPRPIPVRTPPKPAPVNRLTRPGLDISTQQSPPTNPPPRIVPLRPAPPPRPAPPQPRFAAQIPVHTTPQSPSEPPPPPLKPSKPNVPKPPPQSSKPREVAPPNKPFPPPRPNVDTREINMKPVPPKKPTILPRSRQ